MQTTKVKPIDKSKPKGRGNPLGLCMCSQCKNGMTIKELKKTIQLAENEIVECEEFIQIIKEELKGRRK